MPTLLSLIFLVFFMFTARPVHAHNGYENTPAKDCCGGEHHRMCRAAIEYGPAGNGKYWFVVPRDPDDPMSPSEVVELPADKVQFVELFPNSPRAGKAHWCGSFEANDRGGYKGNGLCAFVPPGKLAAAKNAFHAALRRPAHMRGASLKSLRLHHARRRGRLKNIDWFERTANRIEGTQKLITI